VLQDDTAAVAVPSKVTVVVGVTDVEVDGVGVGFNKFIVRKLGVLPPEPAAVRNPRREGKS